MICDCPPERLCETCLAGRFDNLRGTAATRGECWAARVAKIVRGRRDRPWPRYDEKVAAIAKRKVEDLARDERLLGLLAAECASWAAKRWLEVSGR